jgi:hypothetical protein
MRLAISVISKIPTDPSAFVPTWRPFGPRENTPTPVSRFVGSFRLLLR